MKTPVKTSLCAAILTLALLIFCDGCLHSNHHSAYRTIHQLAIAGDADGVAADLKANPNDLNLPGDGGRTALHFAVLYCHTNVVGVLLEDGADVNPKEKDGATPMHLAAQRSCVDAVKILFEKGAQVNFRDEQGRTPLMRAKQWGQDTNSLTSQFLRQHGGTE
jgi:ankyrin repeat protein